MKVSSKIMATAAALAMGSFVASAGNAEYLGPQGGHHHSSQTTVKSTAVSASGGVAVKGYDIFGTGIKEGSLALQFNASQVEAKAGSASGTGAADASAGSTAETKSSSHQRGPTTREVSSFTNDNPNGDDTNGENGGGHGGGGCGCSGTSASSEGTSAASASVGG